MFGGLWHLLSLFSVNMSKRGATSTTNVCSYEKLMSEPNTPSSSAGTSKRRQLFKPPSIIRKKQVPEMVTVNGGYTMSGAPRPTSIWPRETAIRPPPLKRSNSHMSTTTLRKVRDSISRFKEATRNSKIQLCDLFGGNQMLMQVTATPVAWTSKKSTGKSNSPSPGVCRHPHLPFPAMASSAGSFRQQ